MLRPPHEQFSESTTREILRLAVFFRDYQGYPCRVCRYFAADLANSLEAGCILSSVLIGCTLLEILARRLIHKNFDRCFAASGEFLRKKLQTISERKDLTLLESFEADRAMQFADFIDALFYSRIISGEARETAKSIYKNVRITLSHGLALRFVEANSSDDERNLHKFFQTSSGVMEWRQFETKIEDTALKFVQQVSDVLESIDASSR